MMKQAAKKAKIGNLTLDNPLMAAPMAGISDKACRMMNREYGCGLVFTEMINDKGLIYGQKRTMSMLDLSEEEGPVAVQIFGKEPDQLAQAAIIAELHGASMININCGCPTPKIVRNGEGAALMLEPARLRAIFRAVVQAVSIPVTVKMRRGFYNDHDLCFDLSGIAEQEGIAAVILHPRSREQFFSGQADWDVIEQLKKTVSIPVIGNGDINGGPAAWRRLEESGCDAIMIGRAYLGNPFIFKEISTYLQEKTTVKPPDWKERRETATRHLELVCRFKGEHIGVKEMRKHLSWYCKGLPGAAKKRTGFNCAVSKEEMLYYLNSECL